VKSVSTVVGEILQEAHKVAGVLEEGEVEHERLQSLPFRDLFNHNQIVHFTSCYWAISEAIGTLPPCGGNIKERDSLSVIRFSRELLPTLTTQFWHRGCRAVTP